jgi:hypothetical protein
LLSVQEEEDTSVIAIRRGRGVTTTTRFRSGLGTSETLHILLERGE